MSHASRYRVVANVASFRVGQKNARTFVGEALLAMLAEDMETTHCIGFATKKKERKRKV